MTQHSDSHPRNTTHSSQELLRAAMDARENAFAPYSSYRVGAAVLDEHGAIHRGCNVENASYGATMCAERVAVFQLVSSGGKQVTALAVVSEDGSAPCGMCLQVIREFHGDPETVPVFCADASGQVTEYRFSQLLPVEFKLGHERK